MAVIRKMPERCGRAGIHLRGASAICFWLARRRGEVEERLRRIRAAGMATDIPEVMDRAKDHGLGRGFCTACLYNLSRPHEEAPELSGGPLEGEFFCEPERARWPAPAAKTKNQ